MTPRRSLSVLVTLLLTLGLVAVASPAMAVTTYVVNSTADDVDGGGCQATPNDCTLREAILAANATPGLDKVNFALGPGVPTINVTSSLPLITDRITISGNTGGAQRVEVSGPGGANPFTGPTLSGQATSQSVIRRLVINGFGGAGIQVLNSSEVNIGSNWIGTDETGLALGGGADFGILLQDASDTQVGALSGNLSNVIAGNDVGVEIRGGSDNLVFGNAIGTDRTGTADLGNSQDGLSLFQATANLILFNVISGNGRDGVRLRASADNNDIALNFIGISVDETPLPNDGNGVTMLAGAADNTLAINSIDHNGGLGIDLGNDGVTPNDNADNDAGPNTLQNFPVITRASAAGGTTTINGRFRSTPNTAFNIELYSSPSCDPSGFGEGQEPLALLQANSDAEGRVTFSHVIDRELTEGSFVTGLATSEASDATSEFSACRIVI